LQEQIDRESIAVTMKATVLTAQTLHKAIKQILRKIKERHKAGQIPHGKQSVKKLMKHNVPTNTIEISGDTGMFDKVARKWGVDYAFYKTAPDKYLLLFKSGQADAITAAFAEYSKMVVNRARDKRPPIREQLKRAAEKVRTEQKKYKARKRAKEVTR